MRVFSRINQTFVLMTPDDQIHEVGQHLLRQIASVTVFVASRVIALAWLCGNKARVDISLLVLVDTKQIEPIILLDTWTEELDSVGLKGAIQALVSDVAKTV